MTNTSFVRSLAALGLCWGALACAPGRSDERASAAADTVAAEASAPADTTSAVDSAPAVDSPRATADTSVRPTSIRTPIRTIGAPAGAIRARGDTGRRGMDSVITPDFGDSSRRLKPVP